MTQDKFVTIPDTSLKMFRLGYGAVDAGGNTSDQDLFNCIDCYAAHGGNVLDTARVYTAGKSEEALGRYFAKSGKRNDFVLISKGGHPPLTDLHHSRLTLAEVGSDLDLSLKALGTDCIDLYFLHRDDESQPIGNLIELLETFVKAGKIRYYGCSNYSAARMAEADAYAKEHGYRGFVANEMFFNVGSKHMNPFPDDTLGVMDKDMLEYHTHNPRNLSMPYFSVCSGFFHKLLKNENDPALKTTPYYTDGNLKVFAKLKSLMAAKNISLSQAMLGFYTAFPFASVPLYGTHKIANLEDALGYLDLQFEAQDFAI